MCNGRSSSSSIAAAAALAAVSRGLISAIGRQQQARGNKQGNVALAALPVALLVATATANPWLRHNGVVTLLAGRCGR